MVLTNKLLTTLALALPFLTLAAPTAQSQNYDKNDLLRVVCEEVDAYGTFDGRIVILQQISSDELSGSEMLWRGRYEETPNAPFTLTVFEADAIGDGPVEARSNDIILSNEPILGPSVGEGNIFWDTFMFRTGALSDYPNAFSDEYDEYIGISFTLGLRRLETGSLYVNSTLERTGRFLCRFPFPVDVTR